MAPSELTLRVNGEARMVPRRPDRPLLGVLRDELGLTGTKYGCGEGECGSCTVLVDGEPARACQLPLGEAAGKDVTTIEGLAVGGRLTPLQRAFLEEGAFQCGYCTPGMIVRATALLRSRPTPSRDEIVEALDGNLCRCCGYLRILRAVERAARLGQEETGGR
jgi:aerobic-type carbon monoxide dehydrogenase small subunit (CoxS/CutS family)